METEVATLQPFESFPRLAAWVERLANANIEGLCLSEWQDFTDTINAVARVANAARDLVNIGLKNDGRALCVIERADKTDPHYRLCDALTALAKQEA